MSYYYYNYTTEKKKNWHKLLLWDRSKLSQTRTRNQNQKTKNYIYMPSVYWCLTSPQKKIHLIKKKKLRKIQHQIFFSDTQHYKKTLLKNVHFYCRKRVRIQKLFLNFGNSKKKNDKKEKSWTENSKKIKWKYQDFKSVLLKSCISNWFFLLFFLFRNFFFHFLFFTKNRKFQRVLRSDSGTGPHLQTLKPL